MKLFGWQIKVNTHNDILGQCWKLDESGIEYYFVYMTGLTGKGNSYRNAANSAKFLAD